MPTRINNGSPPWAHLCLRFLAASRCLRQYFFSAALIARFCDGFIFSDGFICYPPWWIGDNLYSSWRDQTEEDQRRIWDEIGLNEFRDGEPYFHPQSFRF
jgi:hypothetical protein